MQRIGQLQAYAQLKEGEDGVFNHPEGQRDQARLIKMRILAEQAVALFLVPVTIDGETGEVTDEKDDEIRFLTVVEPGLDDVEFYWLGSFALRTKGGHIWLDTYDNSSFDVVSADPVSFARLWEREERDPRILEIERTARYNRMRLEQQMEEDRAQFARQRAELAALVERAEAARVNPVSSAASPSGQSDGGASASTPGASGSPSARADGGGASGDAENGS